MDTNQTALEQMESAAALHNITIDDVIKVGDKWFIKCSQLVNEDGCGAYATFIHTDLDEMYQTLALYFKYNEGVDIVNIFGTDLFEYLAGEMFLDKRGQPITAKMTVKDVQIKQINNGRGGNEDKPVVSFKERPKLLVLNKTNARAIAVQYGGETDDWVGEQIAITAEHGAWFGKKGVRVVVLDHLPANGKRTAKSNEHEPSETAEQVPWDELTGEPLID